jgi:hypothetical protein
VLVATNRSAGTIPSVNLTNGHTRTKVYRAQPLPTNRFSSHAVLRQQPVSHKGGGVLPILTFQIGRGCRVCDLIEEGQQGLACRRASVGFAEVEKVPDNVGSLLIGFVADSRQEANGDLGNPQNRALTRDLLVGPEGLEPSTCGLKVPARSSKQWDLMRFRPCSPPFRPSGPPGNGL